MIEAEFVLMITIFAILLMFTPFISGYFLSPYFRCKFKRMLLKRNYIIVNLISKNEKIITTMIKNLDHDVFMINDKLWYFDRNKIYDDKGLVNIPISNKNIVSLQGIPTLFLSMDTMYPLSFESEKSDTKPEELGSIVKAYIITKEAELLGFKNWLKIGTIVLICIMAISVYYSFSTYNLLDQKVLPLLNTIISNMQQNATMMP